MMSSLTLSETVPALTWWDEGGRNASEVAMERHPQRRIDGDPGNIVGIIDSLGRGIRNMEVIDTTANNEENDGWSNYAIVHSP